MKLLALAAILLSTLSSANGDEKVTPSIVELPRPNSGAFSSQQAEARKSEILSNAATPKMEDWKNPYMGFCVHIGRDDSLTIYSHWMKGVAAYSKPRPVQSVAEIARLRDELPLEGNPAGVLITSDVSLKDSKVIHEVLNVLFVPSVQLFYVRSSAPSGWLKSKSNIGKGWLQSMARDLAEKAAESLARAQSGDLSDLQGFRMQVRALKTSLSAKDYTTARECAAQIDKLLQTKIVAQSIEFLRIEATEGTQKAKAAVQSYMAQNNLEEAEIKALHEIVTAMERTIAQTDTSQRIELVALIIYLACEQKIGHEAVIPYHLSRIVMAELLGVELPPPSPSQPSR